MQVVCRIAFATDPGAAPTWVDVSAYVRSFSVRRGRQFELDRYEAGTIDIVLKNLEGRFDPTNTAGPYYPLRPGRLAQLAVTEAGVEYKLFTGYVERWPPTWQAGYSETVITAVDALEFFAQATAAATAKASLAKTFTGSNNNLLFTSVDYHGNDISVAFVNNGNSKLLETSVSGTAITVQLATDAFGTITSTAAEVKAVLESARTTGTRASFNLGFTGSNNDMIIEAAEPGISGNNLGVTLFGSGANQRLETSLSGTLLVVQPATSSGSADLTTAAEAKAVIEAAQTTGESSVKTITPSGSNNNMAFYSVDKPGGGITIRFLNSGASLPLVVSVSNKAIAVQLATDGSSVITSTAATVKAAIEAHVQAAALITVDLTEGDGSGLVATVATSSLTGGVAPVELGLFSVRLTEGDGTGLVHATSGGYLAGGVEPVDWSPTGALTTVTLTEGDGSGLVTAFGATALSGGSYAAQVTGTRIGAILDGITWPAADRMISAGTLTLLPDGWDASSAPKALDAINQIADADGGGFFATRDGKAKFYTAADRAGASVVMTFGDTGIEVPYMDLEPSYDKDRVLNHATVTRPAHYTTPVPVEQTVTDTTSISRYWKRSYTAEILAQTDAACLARATDLIARYKEPAFRVDQIVVSAAKVYQNNATLWALLMGLEIGSKVTVKKRPAYGGTISLDCFVEGIAHSCGPALATWKTTLQLSPTVFSGV